MIKLAAGVKFCLISCLLGLLTINIPARSGRFDSLIMVVDGTTAIPHPTAMAVADIDGDGDKDVIEGSGGVHPNYGGMRGRLVIQFNDGGTSPRLTNRLLAEEQLDVRSIRVADLDHDGDLDIIVALSTGIGNTGQVVCYENDGKQSPGFTRSVLADAVQGPDCLSIIDMDNDGDLDVALLFTSYSVSKEMFGYLENNGLHPPNFTARMVANQWSLGAVFAADLDHDGDADMAVSSTYYKDFTWYESNGAKPKPSFTPHTISGAFAKAICAADFDGDGDLDLATGSGDIVNTGQICWYGKTATGYAQHTIDSATKGVFSISASDMDSDGDMDLVATVYYTNQVIWYENKRSGTQVTFTRHVIDDTARGPRLVCPEDLDKDGRMDLIVGADNKAIGWYRNLNAAGFVNRIINFSILEAYCLDGIDFDRDGDMDMLVADTDANYGNQLVWYESDGKPRPGYEPHIIISSVHSPKSMRVGDINGDGASDLAVSYGIPQNVRQSVISWFQGNGKPKPDFTEHVITTTPPLSGYGVPQMDQIEIVDLDKDGDQDLVTFAGEDNRLLWLENGGTATFTVHPIDTIVQDSIKNMVLADVDHDGFMDILTCSYDFSANKTVACWQENLGKSGGALAFKKHALVDSTDRYTNICAADMDLDGNMEIVMISGPQNKVFIYKSSTQSEFSLAQTVDIPITSIYYTRLTVGDVDHDGRPDLLVNDGSTLFWMRNQATGFGWNFQISNNSPYPYLCDMDKDGDLDILTSRYGENAGPMSIVWHENLAQSGAANWHLYR